MDGKKNPCFFLLAAKSDLKGRLSLTSCGKRNTVEDTKGMWDVADLSKSWKALNSRLP